MAENALHNKSQNGNVLIQLGLLFVIVLLSRIPFLNPGYGVEEDSWGMMNAIRRWSDSGIFETSRFPGHPILEFVFYAMPNKSAWLLNLITAIFSALAAVFFSASVKASGFKNYLSGAFAIAFVPVVYINSTNNMDYIWALCFVLMSWFMLLQSRFVFCGILLGIATGCRITSLAMLLPFYFLLNGISFHQKQILSFLKISVAAFAVAFICFMPIIKTYGWQFFTHPETLGYPQLAKTIFKSTIGVFGVIGCCAIIFFVMKILFSKQRPAYEHQNNFMLFCISGMLIFVASFILLPQKSAFLIPAIPFFILLMMYSLNQNQFLVFTFLIVASNFFFGINLADDFRGAGKSGLSFQTKIASQPVSIDLLKGPLIAEYDRRKQKKDFTRSVVEKLKSIQQPTVLIAGWWINEIEVTAANEWNRNVKAFYFISEVDLSAFKNSGAKIYYLPQQQIVNDKKFGKKFTAQYALPMFEDKGNNYVY